MKLNMTKKSNSKILFDNFSDTKMIRANGPLMSSLGTKGPKELINDPSYCTEVDVTGKLMAWATAWLACLKAWFGTVEKCPTEKRTSGGHRPKHCNTTYGRLLLREMEQLEGNVPNFVDF